MENIINRKPGTKVNTYLEIKLTQIKLQQNMFKSLLILQSLMF